jgi:hypothetical protein
LVLSYKDAEFLLTQIRPAKSQIERGAKITVARRIVMKIELEGTLLSMTPENDREKEELNQLWTIIIGCIDEGKKLVPVGQYLPGIKETATFNIE